MNMIACCGLDCAACPAHRSWNEDDDILRRDTAAEWSRLYHAEITPEQVACRGCHADQAPQFGHCRECAVRACARDKGWENCAPCPEFPCSDLSFIIKHSAQARQTLAELRAGHES